MKDFTLIDIARFLDLFKTFGQLVVFCFTANLSSLFQSGFELISNFIPNSSLLGIVEKVITTVLNVVPIGHLTLLEVMLTLIPIYFVAQLISWITDIAT